MAYNNVFSVILLLSIDCCEFVKKPKIPYQERLSKPLILMRSLPSLQIPLLGLGHFPASLAVFEIRTFFRFSEHGNTGAQ